MQPIDIINSVYMNTPALSALSTNRTNGRRHTGLCTVLATIAISAIFPLTSTVHAQSYVGQGRVANVTALSLVGVNVFNTGNLASTGGTLNAGSLPINLGVGLPPITTAVILKADESFASTVGASGSVTSTAGISAISLLSLEVLGSTTLNPAVTVGALTSYAHADASGTFGYSQIANLKVGTQVVNLGTIMVNGQIYTAPNQTIDIAGVKLIVNEQIVDANGTLTVNALRVQASPLTIGLADITLGTTRAGFTPAAVTTVPEPGSLALIGGAVLPFALGAIRVIRRRKASK